MVEAQHTASTMKIVDNEAEQTLLENLLEGSKPVQPSLERGNRPRVHCFWRRHFATPQHAEAPDFGLLPIPGCSTVQDLSIPRVPN